MDDHWNIFFINLTFDCQGVPSEQFLVNSIVDQIVDINLQGCTFINTGKTEESEPSESEPSEPTTEEGGQQGQETGQEGFGDGQKDFDQGDEEKPTQDTQEGQEGIDTGTQTSEPEQTKPSDSGTQEGQEQKQEEPEQSTDTGTVSGNTNIDRTPTSGTTASPDKKDDGTPTSEAKEAPKIQTETPASVTVTIVTDTGTTTINADDGQNIPVTVPVTTSDSIGQSGSITTGHGQTIEGVTVNSQPVTLPDGSGTVTINVVVESPTHEAEQGQMVKSESLTRTSEPTLTQLEQQKRCIQVVQIIQAVLLACILGFLIGDRVNRKKVVEKDAEMK